MNRLIVALVVSVASFSTAFGENRYSLSESEEGTIRLDKKTGAVSYCKKVGGGVACSMAADERTVLLQSIEELSQRIDQLELQIDSMQNDESATASNKPIPPGDEAVELKNKDSEEHQIDKAMRVAENVMRKFIAMAKELKNEFQSN